MLDTGSTGFMLVCTMLVLLMTPGLAFFYGGLSRRKNVVNTMVMIFAVLGIVGVAWVACGWSFAYGGDGSIPVFGGLDQLGCLSAVNDMVAEAAGTPDAFAILSGQGALGTDPELAASYPAIIDIVFQMAFAMITCAIITGAVAGRMKFGAVCAFVAVWVLAVYAPLAHMVWGGEGSLIGEVIGALDFAGGDVVHISSGLTGLVLCIMLGRRKGFAVLSYRPHNVPFVALGAALLWFGWFGFNAGSEFAADGVAALALLNTVTASAAGVLSWLVAERVHVGKCTLVGAATGLVAGLVAITPAAGFVEPWAALVMGAVTSPVVYAAIAWAKRRIGYDDALDAFGCHCVGGIVGGVLTGLFCVPELSWTDAGGLLYTGDWSLLGAQVLGIVVTVVFVVAADVVLGFIVRACFGGSLRVSAADEAAGLDVAVHGESAYPAYLGLD
ncbi:MAG: ammonium transporter [Adlercreutzia caecimuris]|uniref:Ammonium transporter n=1 Tax=Adlercreutzia caecimuris TaxID=671266 RepID=A0A4S4G4X2_9ACTN|nr:ammonium transporter [Adlercreutzia caecimuris]MCI9208949.1 ammonium transporter [Adlercreutzia caecimuris]NBJ66271.1 ammonium transporter [Adlercreutzia caecimuris]THG38104.1 ammonium transporter [Adlercreutzia caecimuris]